MDTMSIQDYAMRSLKAAGLSIVWLRVPSWLDAIRIFKVIIFNICFQ